MTVDEIIIRADELKPNSIDPEMKRGWVETLEARIQRNIIDTHEIRDENGDGVEDDAPADGLIATGVTDGAVYVWWLLSQIELSNGDLVRYNNDSALFNTYYADFAAYWNRTHTPIAQAKLKY